MIDIFAVYQHTLRDKGILKTQEVRSKDRRSGEQWKFIRFELTVDGVVHPIPIAYMRISEMPKLEALLRYVRDPASRP